MVYSLCHTPDGAPIRFESAQRVWKGDAQRPVPLNLQKLREAAEMQSVIRFRQFQSTTSDDNVALKYRAREDGRGFLWIIDVPAGFVGAREVSAIAWRAREKEILFAPFCAFLGARNAFLELFFQSLMLQMIILPRQARDLFVGKLLRKKVCGFRSGERGGEQLPLAGG